MSEETSQADLAKVLAALETRMQELETAPLPKEIGTLDKRIVIIEKSIRGLDGLKDELDALEGRLKILESKPAGTPTRLTLEHPKVKSPEEVMADHLEELQTDPSGHIAELMAGGLTKVKAKDQVVRRIAYLKAELGLEETENRPGLKKAAATALIMLGLLFSLLNSAHADSQGFPQTFIYNTNLPTVLTPGQTTLYQEYNPSNYFQLRSYSGIGIQEIFGGIPLTNYNSGEYTFLFPMIDGTNAATQPQFVFASSACASNGIVCVATNYSQQQLKGVWGYEYMVSNGAGASIWFNQAFTNGAVSVSNAPPGGISFNRPNQ